MSSSDAELGERKGHFLAANAGNKFGQCEGHGFSRAINRMCPTASAAEVRFSKRLTANEKLGRELRAELM